MSAYSDAVQADSPISYWRLGETSGTSAADMQGVNTGTYTGTPGSHYFLNQVGAIAGDGDKSVLLNSGYVLAKAGAIVAGLTNFSIEMWVYTNTTPGASDALYCERPTSGNDMVKLQLGATGLIQLAYRDDAGTLNTTATSSASIVGNAWHHVVLTKSGTSVILYIDGASAGSGSLTATNTMTNTLSSRWGGDAQAAGDWLAGLLDEVALYSTALSGAAVSSHYAVGTGATSTDATAGNAAGTGTGSAARASLKPNAAATTGTGAVSAVAFSLKPTAAATAATGAAGAAAPSLKPTAGNTAGTGAASAASAGSSVLATAGTTSGTGAAASSTASLKSSATTATATGSAISSAIGAPLAPHLTLDMNPRAAAPNASAAVGTGASSGMTGKAAPTLAAAAGTGAAAVTYSKPAPNAANVAGTGIARVANGKVSAKATNAGGTGVAGAPTAIGFTTIQAAVNAASAGSTVNVPAGTYRETVTINKALTLVGLPGAIIDGRNISGTAVRASWLSVTHDDVTVRGFTMQYTTGGYSTQYSASGVSVSSGINRFVLDACDLSYSWVNVSIIGAIDSTISNCDIHDATHLGVRAGAFPGPTRGLRQTISGNTIFHNNRAGDSDPDSDGGNLKATNADQLIVDGNEVYDSTRGIWLDVVCLNSIIRNNKLHDHDETGVFDETSTGTKIYGNACWANGFGLYGTAWWGAGIGIASSKDAEVYNNTLGWNRNGISVSSQNRVDNAGSTGHYVHDNTVVATLPTGSEQYVGLWFVQDWAGQMYAPASNNTGLNNKFWYPDTTTLPYRFYWNGNLNLAGFQATAGGTGSSYISDPAKTAALAAAGIPATP